MPDCLFCRMVSGEFPVELVAEDDQCIAIRDVSPRAPIHDLIIPRTHVETAKEIEWTHGDLLAGMFVLSTQVARFEGVFEGGYRLAFNVGDNAGMTIHHLHLHLLGGRRLGPEG